MKFENPISVMDIAGDKATLKGNDQLKATGINEIHKVESGDITFVDHPKYYTKSLESAATIIIIDKDVEVPEGKAILICDNPFKLYNDLVLKHRPFKALEELQSSDADIHETAIIEPGVTLANNVKIGEGCYIQAGAYIGEHTVIGKDVVVQAGAIIGTDAFYFKKENGHNNPWRSCGRVILEDRVSIGAGCTINKGVSGDTIIGEGTKVDCQVHIAHGVVIGKNCLIAAQVGIAGKTIIGDDCTLYGQAGLAHGIHIGNKTTISAKAGVSKDLEGGKLYFGVPAIEAREKYRELAALRQLPEILKKLNL